MNQEFKLLFEDQDLLVINKPPGVVVNDAHTSNGYTVQQWMNDRIMASDEEVAESEWLKMIPRDFDDQYGTPTEVFLERKGMVHRLDKNTSGALVLAKHPGSIVHLLAQFRDRKVEKEYLCLVHGHVSPVQGIIDGPIGRSSQDRKKFAVVPNGRPAQTEYKVDQVFAGLNQDELAKVLGEVRAQSIISRVSTLYQGFSLLRCFPKTGRTHQIRVHLAHLNHPLVGDSTYIGRKRQQLDPQWCPRHFLHASKVSFRHPRTNEVMVVEAPLPEDLQTVQKLMQVYYS